MRAPKKDTHTHPFDFYNRAKLDTGIPPKNHVPRIVVSNLQGFYDRDTVGDQLEREGNFNQGSTLPYLGCFLLPC